MKVDHETVVKIGESLVGTCRSLDEACEEHGVEYDDLTTEDCREIDEIAFRCECCEWWVEPSEITDGTCTDCARGEQ